MANVTDVTRHISKTVERELWARAAGRCQFDGCNSLLYRSPVTQEATNLAEKAHIYSFSEKGPRGWGPFKLNNNKLNDISNLMLLCHGCHKKIDQDVEGSRYSASLLIHWKEAHERRIEIVTGIQPSKKSHVILYGANIGLEKSPIEYHPCVEAMFPDWYPASERPTTLSMVSELNDHSAEYWNAESSNLRKSYERKIASLIEHDDCKHFSVFAFAPQPLLILLGSLLTDKVSVETYQLNREPKGWHWQSFSEGFDFIVHRPTDFKGHPVLVFSLSGYVTKDRITRIVGDDISIWEITIKNPNNNFMRSKDQLSLFREHVRQLIVDINLKHGNSTPLYIFPAMPITCAIELGRARMPKADMPWIIYDQDRVTEEFIKSIEITGTDVE